MVHNVPGDKGDEMKKTVLAIQVKTTIYNEESPSHGVLSMGTIALLRGVERTGSLNKAAKEMKMAYSKAWTLLRGVEENFGAPLIARRWRTRIDPHSRRQTVHRAL